MNEFKIRGVVVREPEVRVFKTGAVKCELTIVFNGYNPKTKQYDLSSFFDVDCWSDLAEYVGDSIRKGQLIDVEGSLKQERWESKDGYKRSRVKLVAKGVKPVVKGSGNGPDVDDDYDNEEIDY